MIAISYVNFEGAQLSLFHLCYFLELTPTKRHFIITSLKHNGNAHLTNNRAVVQQINSPPPKKNLNIFICDVYQGHALLAPYSDQAVLLLILNTHIVPLDKGFAVTLKDVSGSKVKVIAELIIKSLS